MSISRRVFARLAVAGAAGLAMLPRRVFAEGDAAGEWAGLGRIWREISKHRWAGNRGDKKREAEFKALKEEMLGALDAIEASPEVRALFEERWYHVNRTHYFLATCYRMSIEGGAAMRARGDVEKQVEELEKLAAEGKISEKTLRKAAERMGPAAEYLTTAREVWAEEEALPEAREGLREMARKYMDEDIEPGEAARKAAARGAELTLGR